MTNKKTKPIIDLPEITLWCVPGLGGAINKQNNAFPTSMMVCDVPNEMRTGVVGTKVYIREINREVWKYTGRVHQLQKSLVPIVEGWYSLSKATQKVRLFCSNLRDAAKEPGHHIYIHNKKVHPIGDMTPLELFRKMGLTRKRNFRTTEHHGLYFEQKAA